MSSIRRGQTLVMMALTSLLCVLMVMMTISIGTKIKEKMEVQTMADAAAYSQAIATARAFNAVSIMNRVGVAHVTGAIAIQSLVSWSTFYLATLNVARSNIQVFQFQYLAWIVACCIPFSPCMSACRCAVQGFRATRTERSALKTEKDLFFPYFQMLDIQAAFELLAVLMSADWLHLLGQIPVLVTMGFFINGQSGADDLTDSSRAGAKFPSEIVVDGTPDGINRDEIGLPAGFALPPKGALMSLNPIWNHHAFAAMGTRLHPFITGRFSVLTGDASLLIDARLIVAQTSYGGDPSNLVQFFIPGTAKGSGYVHNILAPKPADGDSNPAYAWFSTFFGADDHGTFMSIWNIGKFPQCPIVPVMIGQPKAHIWSSAAMGEHKASGWSGDNFHILGTGVGGIRSYPWFFDYNMIEVARPSNIWGQPKMFGVVKRDLASRPAAAVDPWNPAFNLTYSTGSKFDARALTAQGVPIGQQTAVGTGVTYYHRGNNFLGYHSGVEPPNFFNPYWRAGLTYLNVDDSGLDDFSSAVGGYPAAVDSFNGLRSAGFQGWQ